MKSSLFSRRHIILLLGALLAAAVIAIFYVPAQYGIGIPCLFRSITGLECPGCGNTRAAFALLRLDFGAAFRYNPMFFVEFFYLAWVLFCCARGYLKGKAFSYKPPFPLMDIFILLAILAWWPIRNFL